MYNILIIEDQEWTQNDYKKALNHPEISVLSAFTLAEGLKLFSETKDISVIVMDGCVDNDDKIDTIPLISHIRKSFKGNMIAASSALPYRERMVSAGCNHNCSKGNVPAKVLELLKLNQ